MPWAVYIARNRGSSEVQGGRGRERRRRLNAGGDGREAGMAGGERDRLIFSAWLQGRAVAEGQA